MKNLMNLKGVKTLSMVEQKTIHGGNASKCSGNCVGKPHGTGCFYQGHCSCPGMCANNICNPY